MEGAVNDKKGEGREQKECERRKEAVKGGTSNTLDLARPSYTLKHTTHHCLHKLIIIIYVPLLSHTIHIIIPIPITILPHTANTNNS